MTRWDEVCEVFAEVRETPPSTWSRRLADRCQGDPEFAAEVRSLLDADREAGRFLAEPPALGAPANRQEPGEGDLLGVYRLLRLLDRGGMGSVWLAEREDGAFCKRAAIKILHRDRESEESLRRFRAERQILASLDHPLIARLLDGGETPEGLPYLVMEYVEGRPIDRFCREEGLRLRERLELFRKVCSAVHFAHQNLVIHGDLKPANILVTAGGTPKLLDFGISRLVNPELAPATLPSSSATRLLTPEYASPEQIRGGALTTASDVYSLGVLLYRLLTGSLPHSRRGRPELDVLIAVCEEEPEPPSTAVRLAASEMSADRERPKPRPFPARRLAGDLDSITVKAVAKEPRRRYHSAEQLAEDLQRHLDGEPVKARDGGWLYRLGRFARRRRWEVAAVTALVVLSLGFGTVTAIQRAALDRSQKQAEGVLILLEEMFTASDPLTRFEPARDVREVLESVLADQPELVADLQGTIGEIYHRMGLTEEALPLLESSLEARRSSFGPEHPAVAESLTRLGRLQISQGELDAASSSLAEALALRERIFGESHAVTADGYNELGELRHHLGRFDEAEALYRRALVIWEEGGAGSPAEIARVLNNLAALLSQRGRLAEAEALHRRALPLRSREYGPESAEVSETLHNLAYLLRLQGSWAEARGLAERALAIRRTVLGEDHVRTAHSLANVAVILHDLGELAQAEARHREAVAIHRRLARDEPATGVAMALHSLALTVEEQGRPGEAESLLLDALGQLDQAADESPYNRGRVRSSLSRILAAQGRHREAEPLARRAVEDLRKAPGPEHIETARAEGVLAECLRERGEEAEALDLLRHALDALETSPDHRARAWRREIEMQRGLESFSASLRHPLP